LPEACCLASTDALSFEGGGELDVPREGVFNQPSAPILTGEFSLAKCPVKRRRILGAAAGLVQMWRPLPISPDFPQFAIYHRGTSAISGVCKTLARRAFQETSVPLCTNSGQVLVGGVHSIETQADRVAQFSLTLKIEGVKT
jgi:hypothetical protein